MSQANESDSVLRLDGQTTQSLISIGNFVDSFMARGPAGGIFRREEETFAIRGRSQTLPDRLVLESNSQFLEEVKRHLAAGTDKDVVILDVPDTIRGFQDHGMLRDLFDLGTKCNLNLSPADRIVQMFRVPFLDACEFPVAIRQHHPVRLLMGKSKSRFDGRVATADDDQVRIPVRFCIEELVHDFPELFSADAQLSGRTPPAKGKDDMPRPVGALP